MGWYYVVSVAGEVEGVQYYVGDWIIWNGTSWDRLAGRWGVDPVGVQKNYFGIGIKGNISTRDYEITMANGDDFDMFGWYVANGQAGTPACIDKFIRGEVVSGVIAGDDDAVVVSHVHDLKVYEVGSGSGAMGVKSTGGATQPGYIETTGISGVNKNIPSKISAIPIIRMS